jgi:YidC/Oxa1 family membrane protein insertase
MDSRRLILFIVLAVALLFVWDKYFAPKINPPQIEQNINSSNTNTPNNNQIAFNSDSSNATKPIESIVDVTTDLVHAQISTVGGNLLQLDLLSHGTQDTMKHKYQLLMSNDERTFIVQTGLLGDNTLPTHHAIYSAESYSYVLSPTANTININLHLTTADGIAVTKSYTFTRGSYVIAVSYNLENNSNKTLNNISAYWSIVRDDQAPEGETRFVHTFTGPVYYTNDTKFEKIKFNNVIDNDVSYPQTTNNGWIGFIQHYFVTLWLLNANNYKTVCSSNIVCRFSIQAINHNLISVGVLTDLPLIAPHSNFNITVPLLLAPQNYQILNNVAANLELTKDYGWVYIFSTPLFWLLVKLFELVHNWGVAIILLTILVKMILYPLTKASYISMGKMKALSPKMEALKNQYKDDKAKLHQGIMQLYKTEKVNPIGGCLPMLLQIPVFIGLYWALLSSVELRYSSFLWIKDLSSPDPYYILPIILAATMFLQTYLNPPVADPVQAKMMKIMPVAFSVMFFFFPAGLVIYWLINNILTMAQQWYVNNHVTLRYTNKKR